MSVILAIMIIAIERKGITGVMLTWRNLHNRNLSEKNLLKGSAVSCSSVIISSFLTVVSSWGFFTGKIN